MSKGLPRTLVSGRRRDILVERRPLQLHKAPLVITATGAGKGFGTMVLGGFPVGDILLLGCSFIYTVEELVPETFLNADWGMSLGLGTTPTEDASISGTDSNLSAALSTSASSYVVAPQESYSGQNDAGDIFDNGGGDLEINLNMLVNADDITDDTSATVLITSSGVISYTVLNRSS